ncbi:MAG: hypothetical protein K8I03_03110 [Ignavibacteria bacterium]|nr:hypothetical protein [Ignavibacteria bacterium]
MPDSKTCSKCGGEMKKGFYYVRNNKNAIFYNFVVWVEGEKDKITSFMGTQASAPQYPLTPWKCSNCGLIEQYADPVEKWRH